MREVETAGIVPYRGRNILVQERGLNSKNGEQYAFFGGHLEPGETTEQAMVREGEEELEYTFTEWDRLGPTRKPQGEKIIVEHTFMVPLPENYRDVFHLCEGKEMHEISIEQARTLRMNPGDNKILDLIEAYLQDHT